jgi:hypothetical protein
MANDLGCDYFGDALCAVGESCVLVAQGASPLQLTSVRISLVVA